jgi:hypothetical protein
VKPRTFEVVRMGLLRVCGRGCNLAILSIAGGTAWLVHSWLLAIGAILAGLLLVAVQLKDVALWRGVVKELRRRPVVLPCESEISGEAARAFLGRLERLRGERERAMDCGPTPASEEALSLVEAAGELEEEALDQIWSLARLERFMFARRTKVSGARQEGRVDGDAAWSKRMAQEHAAVLAELGEMKDQLEARLAALIDTLTVLPCRLAALRMRERPDVAGVEDRTIRERLATEMTITQLPPVL